VDVAVIGAGPAGTCAAALLHRAGHSVAVFERQRFPRFVIGESLLPRCNDLLDAAGLLKPVQERGYLVKRGATFLDGERRCDFDFSEQFTPGWDHTWQVPRADFDNVLAEAVQKAGVPIFFEHGVTGARVGSDPRLSVRGPDGADFDVDCRFIVDASGYGRVLPRLLELDAPSDFPPRRSLFAHVTGDRRPAGPEEGRIWIVIHPDGAWIWIIPFSDGRTSVGVVAEPGFYSTWPGAPEEALRAILASSPVTARRLADVELAFEPRVIEGYAVSVKRLFGEGFCLVGNATEFLDPIFSSGVTLALESAHRASGVLDRQLRGEAVDWQADYADYMGRGIDTFRSYVSGWYDGTLSTIFFAAHPDPEFKRMICSVLAGYVWDDSNPFVREHRRKLPQLARVIQKTARGL